MTSHVLETVERVCDRVAIITRRGDAVREGDITALADDRPVSFDGRDFTTLESLSFLHAAGETSAKPLACL